MLARKAEVQLHARQTMTEQIQLCEWEIFILENYIVVRKSWDAPVYPTCPCTPLQ
jgi:hypothetical protein